MALTMQRETTEYVYLGATGTVPSVGAEIAFLESPDRPTEPDWNTAVVVDDVGDPLWADAVAALGLDPDYYVAVLVGDFDSNPFDLAPGVYRVWLRLTDTEEQPVRLLDETLTVA